MLELKDVSKSFFVKNKEIKVLKNIDISFRKKEFVSIIGKSGSGKTTLLNIIGLLDEDYSGTIYLNGKDISKYKDFLYNKLLRSKIGFVFQDYNLVDNLTVYQNIDLALKIKGINKNVIDGVLKRCNIFHLKDQNVRFLSGGEKQRVAIARVLASNPDIILLDEPTGALDMQNSKLIIELLKNVFYDKLIIMITHDKVLAKKYSDRIILLNDGEILYDSSPYLLKYNKKLFISKRKMTFLNILKYSFLSLKRKKFRNILTMLAITISISIISLVLFLSSGVNNKMIKYKNSFLGSYPLIITENYKINKVKGKVNRYTDLTNAYLDKNFVSSLEEFCVQNNIKYLVKYDKRLTVVGLENQIFFDSYLDNLYLKKNYKLLSGSFPKSDNEVLLKLRDDSTNSKLFDYFKFNSNAVGYDDFLSKNLSLKENGYTLKIVGIVKPKSKLNFDDFLGGDSNFLYRRGLDEVLTNKSEYSIYVYKDKKKVKNYISSFSNINYQDMAQIFETYLSKGFSNVKKILVFFSFVSLLISLILIFSMTYTAGIERQKEIGILKSLGARRIDIRRIFTSEVVILSLLAIFVSFLFLFLTLPFFNKIIYNSTGIKGLIDLSLKEILKILLIGILTGLLGSIIPAIKNSKKDVIKCLK